jgi:hypothetical protein
MMRGVPLPVNKRRVTCDFPPDSAGPEMVGGAIGLEGQTKAKNWPAMAPKGIGVVAHIHYYLA